MPKLDARGRVTLPPTVREGLGLRAGGPVVFTHTAGGWVIQRAAPRSTDEMEAGQAGPTSMAGPSDTE